MKFKALFIFSLLASAALNSLEYVPNETDLSLEEYIQEVQDTTEIVVVYVYREGRPGYSRMKRYVSKLEEENGDILAVVNVSIENYPFERDPLHVETSPALRIIHDGEIKGRVDGAGDEAFITKHTLQILEDPNTRFGSRLYRETPASIIKYLWNQL